MPLRGWSNGEPTSSPVQARPPARCSARRCFRPVGARSGRCPAGSVPSASSVLAAATQRAGVPATLSGDPARAAPLPGQRLERPAQGQRGRGEHDRAAAEQPLRQQPAHLQRGHPERAAGGVAAGGRSIHTTSRGPAISGPNACRIRSAALHLVQRGQRGPGRGQLAASSPASLAAARTRPRSPRRRPAARPAPRRAARQARRSGRSGRPGTPSARRPPAAGRLFRDQRPQRRAAASGGPGQLRRADAVTRSTRSCASSMITTSCSGSTAKSSRASIASRAWLVTTMSAGRPPHGPARRSTGAERAALGADALPRCDRDLPPGLLVDPGHQLVTVAGAGAVGPLVQPLHLPPDRRRRARIEEHVRRILRRAGPVRCRHR